MGSAADNRWPSNERTEAVARFANAHVDLERARNNLLAVAMGDYPERTRRLVVVADQYRAADRAESALGAGLTVDARGAGWSIAKDALDAHTARWLAQWNAERAERNGEASHG